MFIGYTDLNWGKFSKPFILRNADEVEQYVVDRTSAVNNNTSDGLEVERSNGTTVVIFTPSDVWAQPIKTFIFPVHSVAHYKA